MTTRETWTSLAALGVLLLGLVLLNLLACALPKAPGPDLPRVQGTGPDGTLTVAEAERLTRVQSAAQCAAETERGNAAWLRWAVGGAGLLLVLGSGLVLAGRWFGPALGMPALALMPVGLGMAGMALGLWLLLLPTLLGLAWVRTVGGWMLLVLLAGGAGVGLWAAVVDNKKRLPEAGGPGRS